MNLLYEHDKPLRFLHTMHFSVAAKYYIEINDERELLSCLPELVKFKQTYWLGGGSNSIFLEDFDGLVLHLNTKGVRLVSETDMEVLVQVEAGESWHGFVLTCIRNGWHGLENLTLIPGTVGAAPVQNIGAYGVEVKDFIQTVHCLDTDTGKLFELSNTECLFSYRNSVFKQQKNKKWIITSVVFKLQKQFTPNLSYQELADFIMMQVSKNELLSAKVISDSVGQLRESKLPNPNILGNSGSFFHNPIVNQDIWLLLKQRFKDMPIYPMENQSRKLAAGWMIDQLGLKGFRVGGIAVHDKQALVIVNPGQGTPSQLLELISIIQDSVQHQFGVRLTIEPNLIFNLGKT